VALSAQLVLGLCGTRTTTKKVLACVALPLGQPQRNYTRILCLELKVSRHVLQGYINEASNLSTQASLSVANIVYFFLSLALTD
jgi:hypothetical protein